jgi:putative OPT family oligopeptide transporter
MWGFSPSVLKLLVVALAGGLLGVLFMIPLRRFLIKGEHGKLPYPEGTACAEVLVAADAGGTQARNVFMGLGIGALYKWLMSGLNLWPRDAWAKVPFLPKGQVGVDVAPALIGVGYILGAKIGLVMVGGAAISWLILIPAIEIIGRSMTEPLYPELTLLITDMGPETIWTRYIRYVGAGAVATAGIATLIRSMPMIVTSFKEGMRGLRSRFEGSAVVQAIKRTDDDLPFNVVLIGVGLVVLFLAVMPHVFGFIESLTVRVLAAILVAIFAFFFVTVSSRIVGLVGVTSNPTSGMTIATLLGTSLIFVALGWTDDTGRVAALSIGAVVAIAASIAGDTSQDLKTGFLLGATPRRQQTGELIGVLTAGFFVCASILALERAYGFGSAELPAHDDARHRWRTAGRDSLAVRPHRRGARVGRRDVPHSVAGLRRRYLPANNHHDADLHRRHDPQAARAQAADAGGEGKREGAGRAIRVRLDRRRRTDGGDHRLLGGRLRYPAWVRARVAGAVRRAAGRGHAGRAGLPDHPVGSAGARLRRRKRGVGLAEGIQADLTSRYE